MANLISKKLKYINKNGEEKEINLYDDFTSFSDYDNGNYIAVQADVNTVGYIYCNSELPEDTTNHFTSFIDKNNSLRYAYTEEQVAETGQPSITYTFTTGYDVMPKINNVVYSSKYKDKRNSDGTTTRTLLSDEPITQICFYDTTNNTRLLSFDECHNIKLTTAAKMFYGCKGLKAANLSGIDTSGVKDIHSMFEDCSSLKTLNLSGIDTSSATTMDYMFKKCSSLTSLDVSNFNTSNVTTMAAMFQECTSLTSLDVSNFNTSKVIHLGNMFSTCSGLTSLNLSNFNTSNAKYISNMFRSCSKLTSLDIRSFSSINITDCAYMLFFVPSTCRVYVNTSKFRKTASDCGFTGSFTYAT